MNSDDEAKKEQFFDITVPSGVQYIELKSIGYHIDAAKNKELHLYKLTTNLFSDCLYVHSSDTPDFLQIYEGIIIPAYGENFNGKFSLRIEGILVDNSQGGGGAYYTPTEGVIIMNFLMHYE